MQTKKPSDSIKSDDNTAEEPGDVTWCGERSGQVIVDGVSGAKTTTWLLDRLRRHLSSCFRTGRRD